jgi:hypothetical protein
MAALVPAIALDIEADIAPDTEVPIGSAGVITAAYGMARADAGMAAGGGPMA